jgi:hypothetical protein
MKRPDVTLARKGKTWAEIYGAGIELGMCNKKHSSCAKAKMSKARKGKTYEEFYGFEKALELRE